MRKNIKYIALVIPIVLALGCTKTMEDMNNDPKSITNSRLSVDGVLFKQHITNMETNLFNLTTSWEYQVQQNLNADVFAGYTMHPGSFGITNTNDNYKWNHGWNAWAFIVAQQNLTEFLSLKAQTSNGTSNTDFYACGLILKVMTALPLVDAFGPFPYLQYGVGINPAFNSVDSIYKFGFIKELTTAIDTLEKYVGGPMADRVKNSGADITSLGGDLKNWIKLANTLKLRLAIRMSDVDPTTAGQYIQEVKADANGLIDATTGDVSIDCAANGVSNPFSFISTAWVDCVMSADMQSFLVGYQDPRLSVYFVAATDDTVKTQGGTYAGVRPGVALTQGKGHYAKFSLLNVPGTFMLLSGAESYFLAAEACVKGLGGYAAGDAQTFYENGVTASFKLHGIEAQAADYLKSTKTPANYVDYSNKSNNYTATTTVTPKWDGTNKLEQIITQKWIAIFPQGAESWAEARRTGFPKLTVPKNMESGDNFDGTIKKGEYLKRLPYPSNIVSISPDQAASAISKYLNGKDDGAQKIWWQK
jgi:hypothetical protein